ncbi:MAG TPA: hypothetical protein VMN04_05925, partial [Thermoanaerobaculia bacterium]|nr:hypothetical protein [Thermoanaerobaculia bacterium]
GAAPAKVRRFPCGSCGADVVWSPGAAALTCPYGAPNATVDWIHGVSNAPSLAVAGYCAKDATGAVSSDDVPDLAACPACVSPDPASGAAGYPMDYPDALACAAAATHTGRPYTWFTAGSQPVYWIAGGAGLSGGPAMTEKGTRAYACGRCHTTGWTANHATDSVVTSQSKAPYLFFPGAGLAGQTPLGSPSALLDPGFGATAFATLAGGGVASVTVTAAGAAYPSAPPPAVSFSGGGGSGAAAHAVLAADPYGLFRVTAVVVDAPGNGYASAPSVSIAPPYALSSWDQWGVQCSRCHVAKSGAHAKNVWTDFPTGGDTIALCMGCHRQENATGPSSVEGGNGFGGNAGNVLPYTASQQQAGGLAPYGQGNQFLNSPHARFTGNFRDVGCPPYANDGYTGIDPGAPGKPALSSCSPGTMNLDGATSSRYASAFARASLFDLTGVSLSGAGSCTTCHDAHRPLNENTAGMSTGIVNRCTFCHTNPASAITPQVYPSLINHPSGSATPLGTPDADPSDSCIVCHMPPGMTHLLRISTDPSYTTFGEMSSGYPVGGPKAMKVSAGAYVNNAPGLVNLSHAAPDAKGYAPAVWVDLDHACRCHGGGVSAAPLTTTGSVTAGSTDGVTVNPVAVADVTGFWPGKRVTIAGAGWAGAPFSTIVAKVVPDASPATSGKVFLAYPAVTTVAGAAV